MSAVTRKIAPKKALGTKTPRVNDDALQSRGALAGQLNNGNPQYPMPVTVLLVAFQLCQWDIRENIIAQVQVCIPFNLNMCIKDFTLFSH